MQWLCILSLALALPSCGGPGEPEAPEPTSVAGRFITPELWVGAAIAGEGGLPATKGRPAIRGPFETRHPVDGRPIQVYERIAILEGSRKRQLLTVTQESAALGRVLDNRTGLPERRFASDVVFPLGIWRQGEVREFEATEFTLLGPALRLITLEVLDIDHVHDGVAHSLRYRLTIRDEARRVLGCEVSVYSPGLGLAAFEASSYWQGCTSCPCPGQSG
jgi:hypothetical protein